MSLLISYQSTIEVEATQVDKIIKYIIIYAK